MATRKRGSSGTPRARLDETAAAASTVVRQAATVLESELSAGLAGARKVETRLTKERRLDQGEVDAVLRRLRDNAHEAIDAIAGRVADLRSDDVQDLSQRLTRDAHDVFDMMINLLGTAPDIFNRLAARAETALPQPGPSKPAPKRGRGGARPPRNPPA